MQIKADGVVAYTRSEQFPVIVGYDPGRELDKMCIRDSPDGVFLQEPRPWRQK